MSDLNHIQELEERVGQSPPLDGTLPAEFVARMEDVLDLYTARPPRTRPVVCVDETPVQLIGEKRRAPEHVPGDLAH